MGCLPSAQASAPSYPFSPPDGGKLGSEKLEGSGAGLETKWPRAVRRPGVWAHREQKDVGRELGGCRGDRGRV